MRSIYKRWQEDGELENILCLVKKWRRAGADLETIADKLGISRAALFDYQKKHKDFADALKKGKEIIDGEIENSLVKECLGYFYEETTTTTTAVIDKATGQITNLERVEKKTVKKYARPNPTAIAYYLNNRASGEWRNNMHIELKDIDDEVANQVEDIVRMERGEQ